jgi:hypothetical protein
MDIVKRYKSLNESYDKILIYHMGIDAGFFTEYTYMLHAMLYCLQHKIQFKLYSDDANFRSEKGWTDFFLPLCEEVHEGFHSKYNKHRLPSWRVILKNKDWQVGQWKLKCKMLNFLGTLYACNSYKEQTYLNYHVKFNSNSHFYIPELGIDGDYFSAFKVMVDITWRLNAETEYDVVRLIQGLNLPDNYVGCQIRGGDKIIETELLSPDLYIKLLDKITFLKNIFVLTDDFQIFKRLQIKSPENNWYTLCEDGEGGYVNKAFSRQIGNVKRLQMIRFIASMQILMQSSVFVGSITTAPSLFLLKLFYPNHCPIDCSTEAFERIVSLRMDERCRMAQIYLSGQS